MQRRDAEELLGEFQGRLLSRMGREAVRAVDVGCGTGEVTAEVVLAMLPNGFKEVIGVDLSSDMIQHARQSHVHDKLQFAQLDIAEDTPDIRLTLDKSLSDTSSRNNNEKDDIEIRIEKMSIRDDLEESKAFDLVTSFYCLHWVQNQSLALTNVYRLLKPGGQALLVLLASNPIFTLYKALAEIDTWREYMQDVEQFTSPYHSSSKPLEKFTNCLLAAGFQMVSSECRGRSFIFDSLSAMQSAIRGVDPFISRLPKELQEQYVADCIEITERMELAEVSQTGCRVRYRLLIAHVVKPDSDTTKP